MFKPLNFILARSRSMRGVTAMLWVGLALLVFTCLWRLAFTNGILARGDTLTYFYPYWHVRNAALMAGQLPLWSPDLFGGVPLLANSQLGTFYPPNWAVAPFAPPEGMRISILAHLLWAAWGMATLTRLVIGARPLVAGAASALFALGGAVGAHVEQINQLQGLAWMPWVFVAFLGARTHLRRVPLLGVALALQFFTGHTQTLFITGSGLVLFALADTRLASPSLPTPTLRRSETAGRSRAAHGQGGRGVRAGSVSALRFLLSLRRSLSALLLGGLLALGLALPQLVPTLEMSAVSNRRGGLNPNEATAFSLSPLLAGRGLLPSYDRPEIGDYLSGEYIAYLGVVGLTLAGLALTARHSSAPGRRAALCLAGDGLLFAFGAYNPLYFSLVAHLPGFNLFRVPARWLALIALGAVLLAAWTLETLARGELRLRRGWLIAVGFALLGLLVTTPLGVAAANRLAGAPETAVPQARTLVGWAVALMGVAAVFALPALLRRFYTSAQPNPTGQVALLTGMIALELFAAAGAMPYHDLSPSSAYDAGRFTAYQLAALMAEQTPPARYLSISGLFFDPGDRAALEARYAAEGLSASAVRNALVAVKLEELLGANLNLRFGLPSADGYDGGLLPTRFYTAFTAPMLPSGELRAVDGRLRERLASDACGGACIPALRWLDLLNVRYLLLDKTYDLWQDDVAYDTAFASVVTPQSSVEMRVEAGFEATALDLLLDCQPSAVCEIPAITLVHEQGETREPTQAHSPDIPVGRYTRVRAVFSQPMRVQAVQLSGADAQVRAATLVDTRTGDFAQMTPRPWSRALSSDIKLYERNAASMLPRAFVVTGAAHFLADDDAGTEVAMAAMAAPDFDPLTTVFLAGSAPTNGTMTLSSNAAPASGSAAVTITAYTPEAITLMVSSDQPGWLIVTDPYYPGWQAVVNGAPVPILRADAMFRAIPTPAGTHEVTFRYSPSWLIWSLAGGAVLWVITLIAIVIPRENEGD